MAPMRIISYLNVAILVYNRFQKRVLEISNEYEGVIKDYRPQIMLISLAIVCGMPLRIMYLRQLVIMAAYTRPCH